MTALFLYHVAEVGNIFGENNNKIGAPLRDDRVFSLLLLFDLFSLRRQQDISDQICIPNSKKISGNFHSQIRIQPVADDRYFPVAHTCFNLLDLPRYKTKERLKYHLTQAIQQTQGFSLV